MNRRERKREAHWIVTRLIQNYLDRDSDDPNDENADHGQFDKELEELRAEHHRKGYKLPS